MYPKVFTVARRMSFFAAFNSSSSSKQMRIHSRGDTMSAPRSAIRPTRSIQFSCTFSCRFFRIGVNRGSKSLIGGCMFVMPMTLTMDLRPHKMLPSTSAMQGTTQTRRQRWTHRSSNKPLQRAHTPTRPSVVTHLGTPLPDTRTARCPGDQAFAPPRTSSSRRQCGTRGRRPAYGPWRPCCSTAT